jgi:uncharacterized membrane protein YhhN
MLKRHLTFTLIFMLIAAGNVCANLNVIPHFEMYVKPLICISLAIYLYTKVNMNAGFNRFIFFSLVLSLIGDCFLLFVSYNALFFICGLIAFLIAHILYTFAFFRDFKNDPEGSKRYGHLMLFIMGVFSLSYYSWIRDYLGDLRIPVMAYMFVISIMVIMAAYRYLRVNALSFNLIYAGAIFFVMSDSALAFNKFVSPFNYAGIVIIGTYMLAQFLITMGAIERIVTVKSVTPKE